MWFCKCGLERNYHAVNTHIAIMTLHFLKEQSQAVCANVCARAREGESKTLSLSVLGRIDSVADINSKPTRGNCGKLKGNPSWRLITRLREEMRLRSVSRSCWELSLFSFLFGENLRSSTSRLKSESRKRKTSYTVCVWMKKQKHNSFRPPEEK